MSFSVQGYWVDDNKRLIQIDGFALFPNPAKDKVTLVIPNEVSTGKVIFVNAQGAIVLQKEIAEEG